MTLLDRLRGRFSSPSAADRDAQDLRTRAGAIGVVQIADITDRSRVEVSGVARSITHPPVGDGPATQVVELYDGSAVLDVVWLGRRAVPGIHPGVHLRVHGRVRVENGSRRMYNPRYEIIPPV